MTAKVNLFVNENLYAFNSGTEHAQARRIRAFQQLGIPAYYVTRNYNRFLARDAASLNLDMQTVINMYDYFQGTQTTRMRKQSLHDLADFNWRTDHLDSSNPNFSLVQKAGRQVARITVLPATVGLVNEVIYNDRAGNPTRRENWDWRGFLSSVDRFTPDGQVQVTQYLNLVGDPVLEVNFMVKDGISQPTIWELKQYHGKNYRFATEDDLFGFFLNELIRQNDGQVNLWSERRSVDRAVSQAQGMTGRYAILHEMHTVTNTDLPAGTLYAGYQDLFEALTPAFDTIFVPSQRQRVDLQSRYPKQNFKVVPDTVVTLPQHIPARDQRIPGHLLVLGRLSAEKAPELALQLLALIRNYLPDVTMEFMGYPSSPDYLAQFKAQVQTLGLGEQVFISKYGDAKQVQTALRRAQILINPSSHEAFGMQLVEGLAAGLPLITMENRYTPNAVVEDGINGYRLQTLPFTGAVPKIVQILEDAQVWQKMSQASLKKAQAFDLANFGTAWQEVLADKV